MPALLTTLFLILFGGIPAAAQSVTRDDFEMLLAPIALSAPRAGAAGSLWISDLWAYNDSDTPVMFSSVGRPTCPICTDPLRLEPGEMRRIQEELSEDGFRPGVLMYVEKSRRTDVTLSLHIRDVSKSDQHLGTELPIVSESEFLAHPISLLDITTSHLYRANLRIYSVGSAAPRFRVSYFAGSASSPVKSEIITLGGRGFFVDAEFPPFPQNATVYDFTSAPELQGIPSVRVRIEPLDDGTKYWAFVALTNNETNLVTVVTPQ
jgi:hypothetical protein